MTLKSFSLITEALAECCVDSSLWRSLTWTDSRVRSYCEEFAEPIVLLGIEIAEIVFLTLVGSDPSLSAANAHEQACRTVSSMLCSAFSRFGLLIICCRFY
jgi:hypothetical protein